MAAKIIVLCVDGWANRGKIFKGVEEAANIKNLNLNSTNYIKTVSQWTSSLSGIDITLGILIPGQALNFFPNEYPAELYNLFTEQLVQNNGNNYSDLNLLVVGKSYGAAKMYKYLDKCSDTLKNFNKVAVVLVDAHEPFAPGDDGMANYDYDYVTFDDLKINGDYYNLKWRNKWEVDFQLPANCIHDLNTKLKTFNIYQRNDECCNPLGYSFYNEYTLNTRLFNMNYTSEKPKHDGIDNCKETVQVICNAIDYLNYFSPEVNIDYVRFISNQYNNNKIEVRIELKFSLNLPECNDLPKYVLYTNEGQFYLEEQLNSFVTTKTVLMVLKFDNIITQEKRIRITLTAPSNWHEQKTVTKEIILYPADFITTCFIKDEPNTLPEFSSGMEYGSNYPDNEDNGYIPYDIETKYIKVMKHLNYNDCTNYPGFISLDSNDFFSIHNKPNDPDKIHYGLWYGVEYWYYDGYIKEPIFCKIFKNNGWITIPEPTGNVEVKRLELLTNNQITYNFNIDNVNEKFRIIGRSNGPDLYDDNSYDHPIVDNVTINLKDTANQEKNSRYRFYSKYLIIVSNKYEVAQPPDLLNIKDKILKLYCDPWTIQIRNILQSKRISIPDDLKKQVIKIAQKRMDMSIKDSKIKNKIDRVVMQDNKKLFKNFIYNKSISIKSINKEIDKRIKLYINNMENLIIDELGHTLYKNIKKEIIK